MKLVYTSNPLSLVIKNYEPMSFVYDGWTVSEEYNYKEKFPKDSEYRLVVSSQDIQSKDKLSQYASKGREITELITKSLPYIAFVSLNEPQHTNFSRTRLIICGTKPIKGWNNNYEEIDAELEEHSNAALKVKCSFEEQIHYARIPKSPLGELKIVLENYENLSDTYKFLIFLHNAIKESEDDNRYMLIGKALEIVNAIYPYERQRGKDDDRIERFHPELKPIFGTITIRNLIEWSNNRQETRHYVSKGTQPHPALTEEEREKLYMCSVELITNIVRKQFGLDLLTFVQE